MSGRILRSLWTAGRFIGLGRLARRVYAIGVYTGESPLSLRAPGPIQNPVVSRDDVDDARALFVADPFMFTADGSWHMFFEAMVWRSGRRVGVISHALSRDGLAWAYQRIVLAEPFHLSYPYVFAWKSDIYMVPESSQANAVRLYRADPFPHRWTHVADLLRGPGLVDSSIVRHGDRWWLFTDSSAEQGCDTLRVFHAAALTGPWTEHPRSPIARGRVARPGGRILSTPDRLVRFAQDSVPTYGTSVRAFEVDRLNEREYEERAHPVPVLQAGQDGWNRGGMHHLDAHQLPDGRWIAAVDGWYQTVVRPREFAIGALSRFEARGSAMPSARELEARGEGSARGPGAPGAAGTGAPR